MKVYIWFTEITFYYGTDIVVVADNIDAARKLATKSIRADHDLSDTEREIALASVAGDPLTQKIPYVGFFGRGD